MAFLSSFYPQPVVAGTTEGTFAEGDDARIVGAAQKAANLSDLVSASSARANLDLEVGVDVAAFNDSRITGALPAATAGTGSVLASGSTTARTLSDRFGEVFHVADYGAVGDWNGTTGTDDTVAIQNAINAAVAAGGGIVRFGANKKYRLDTRTGRASDTIGMNLASQRHFLRVGSGNLTSNFGSTSMMLYFEGNGATLHATSFSTGANDIIYVCCQFHTMVFSNLKFTREVYEVLTTGSQLNAIAFFVADTNEINKLLVENCYFNDNSASLYFNWYNFNERSVYGKFKQVDVINCTFEHDNGQNGRIAGPPVVIFARPWIKQLNVVNCYANGLTSGQIPNSTWSTNINVPPLGPSAPAMDNFLWPTPIRTNIQNCYFTNFDVEVIKASDEESFQTGIRMAGNYSQISVGDSVTRQITLNGFNKNTLVVGKIYGLFDPDGAAYPLRRGGYYRLEPKTGGGNYTFAVGTDLTFTRVSSEDYDLPPEHEITTFSNNNISLIDMDLLDQANLIVQGCTFDSKNLKDVNGDIYLYNGSECMHNPDILCGFNCQIVNNIFKGGGTNLLIGISLAQYQPTIISNNYIYKFTDLDTQPPNGGKLPIYVGKSNVSITGNVCVFRESRCSFAFVRVVAHDVLIKNNICMVMQPSSFGSGGVTVTALVFIDYLGGPWRVVAEDNYLRDLESYARASVDGYVGHFTGSIRGTVARSVQPTSTQGYAIGASNPITMAKQHKSPDGSTGLTIYGTGAPTTSAPNGSLYLRTDGDASTTLYVRAGGTWKPLSSYEA